MVGEYEKEELSMARNATNKLLHKAKKSKSDEFYTQYIDIQKEIEAYLEYNPDVFRGKVVYCNCDLEVRLYSERKMRLMLD